MSAANQYTEYTEPNEVNRSVAEIAEGKQTAEGCPQGKRSAVNADGWDGTAGRGEFLTAEMTLIKAPEWIHLGLGNRAPGPDQVGESKGLPITTLGCDA